MKFILLYLLFFIIHTESLASDRLKSESEQECLTTVLIGEISNGTEYEQRSFLWFFHYEESKHKSGYCSEFFSYKLGGAKKYSSSTTRNLLRISEEKKNKQIYKKVQKLIKSFVSGRIKPDATQQRLRKMTNVYATRKWGTLSWHKKHLIDKIVIGKKTYSQHKWS